MTHQEENGRIDAQRGRGCDRNEHADGGRPEGVKVKERRFRRLDVRLLLLDFLALVLQVENRPSLGVVQRGWAVENGHEEATGNETCHRLQAKAPTHFAGEGDGGREGESC